MFVPFLLFIATAFAQQESETSSLDACLALCRSDDTATIDEVASCALDCLVVPETTILAYHRNFLLPLIRQTSNETMECAQSCLDESSDDTKFDCMVECLQEGFDEEGNSRRRLAGGGHGRGAYIQPYYGGYGGAYIRPYYRPYVRPYVRPYYGAYRRPWGGYYGRAPYLRGGFHHRRLAQTDQEEGGEVTDDMIYNMTSICLTYCDKELPGLIADDLNLTLEERENITDFFDFEDEGICLSSCVFSLLGDPQADYTVEEEYKPTTVQCLVGCVDVQDDVVQERLEKFQEEHSEVDFSEVDLENLEVEYCFLQCLDPNATTTTTEEDSTAIEGDTSGRRRMAGGRGRYGGYYGGGAYIRPYYGGGAYVRPVVRPYVQPYYGGGAYVRPYYGGYRRGGYYGGYRGYRGWH